MSDEIVGEGIARMLNMGEDPTGSKKAKRPRTIMAEREAELRDYFENDGHGDEVWAELDAERAAHDSSEQTIQELKDKIYTLRERKSELEQTIQRLEGELTQANTKLELSRTQTKDAFYRVSLERDDALRERELSDQLSAALQHYPRCSCSLNYQCKRCAALSAHAAIRAKTSDSTTEQSHPKSSTTS